MLRGGAYKPRTSPYAFQGLGQEGLRLLAEAKERTGLPIVTELMDARDIEPVLEVADVIQVGARNMQNFPLLAEIGRSGRPVLLKRGPVGDAGRAADGGRVRPQGRQPERDAVRAGDQARSRTATARRSTCRRCRCSKSSRTCRWSSTPATPPGGARWCAPMSLAAAAAGADGIIVEVHPNPDEALCDGPQALLADDFADYAAAVEQRRGARGEGCSAPREGGGARGRADRRLDRPGRAPSRWARTWWVMTPTRALLAERWSWA